MYEVKAQLAYSGDVMIGIAKADSDRVKAQFVVERDEASELLRLYHDELKAASPRTYRVIIKLWRDKRTLDQNKLHWSLCRIMSFTQEGNDRLAETFHDEQLRLYSPDLTDEDGHPIGNPRRPGERVYMRSKDMDTREMSRLVEADFRELSYMGVSLEHSEQCRNFMIEWVQWRWAQGDPLSDDYKDVDDYKSRTPWCEATTTFLGHGGGHIAHIVSDGAGGPREVWNLVHLSPRVHSQMHDHGWDWTITEYPILAGKVTAARNRWKER